MRVVHIIDNHSPQDARVHLRQAKSLAAAGYDVHILGGLGAPPDDSQVTFHPGPGHAVEEIDIGRPLGERLTWTYQMYRAARRLRADVYHIHEPLLIPTGLLLKATGARVIYDAHEDYRAVARRKSPPRSLRGLRRTMSYTTVEALARRWFDGIIAATPHIAEVHAGARRLATARNYPVIGTMGRAAESAPYSARGQNVTYVGGITRARGIAEIVRAMALLPSSLGARLTLAGRFRTPELAEAVAAEPGWAAVDYLGMLPYEEIPSVLARARAGLVTLHPAPNHTEAMPVKMFEYMDAGLPVIATDFPLWRSIIEEAGCGLLVDPLDPAAIADAIRWLLEQPEKAQAMGERGRHAVRTRLNWAAEEPALLGMYEAIGCRPGGRATAR